MTEADRPVAEPNSIADRAVAGAAWMVAFRMFSRGLGLASTLVLARLLDSADFGIVAIAFTVSAALNSVSNVGVTENLVRAKTVGRAELDTGWTVQLLKGGLTGVALLLIAPAAAAWFEDGRLAAVIAVLAGMFAIAGAENIGVVLFRREMRFDREFQLSAIERVLTFVATLTAALLLRSYWALVIGMVTAKVARVGASYVLHPYRPRLGLRAWRELAGFSFWMWLSSLVYIVWFRADPLVVGSQVSKATLGLYVVALDIALLPATEIMEPIGAVLFAGFAAQSNAGRDPRRGALAVAVALMTVMAPIAMVISAASTDIVNVLLGDKWSHAAPVVAILTFSVVLYPFSNTAAQSLTASGRVRENLLIVLAATAIKVAVLFVAAQGGDVRLIATAALAITSAEASLFVMALRRNGSSLRGSAGPLGRALVAFAASALALWLTGLGWSGDVVRPIWSCLWQGAVLGGVGLGSYALVLFGLWHLVGRPDGPEQQILAVSAPALARLGRRAGLLKPAAG